MIPVVYDNIIFTLQRSGGISVVWNELLRRARADREIMLTELDYTTHHRWMERYRIPLPKYTKYPVVALMCYYGLLYFSLEMIYIRQATAVALCFFALQYIRPKRIVPYLLVVLLACTFHRVAALMLPLFFVLDKKISEWIYLTVVGVGAIVMLIGVPWLQTIFLTIAGWFGELYAEKAEMYVRTAMFSASLPAIISCLSPAVVIR